MIALTSWPQELMIHYWRLEENYRRLIFSYFNKYKQSNIDVLKIFIETISKLTETQKNILNNSEFLFLAANAYLLQGKFDKIYDLCSRDALHPGLLNIRIYSLISQRKFDEVPNLLTKAYELSKTIDPYNAFFAKANNLFFLYSSQDFKKLEVELISFSEFYKQLLKEFSSSDYLLNAFNDIYAFGKSNLITLYRREGKLEEGIQEGKELISIAQKTKNRYILNRLLNNTALCLIEIGNLKDGLDFLEESFKFSQILANELQLSSAANNIGFIYRNMGNLEMAMKYFYIALDNAKKVNLIHYIIAAETNIAHLHIDFGNPKLALSNSETALESLNKSQVSVPPQIKIALFICQADAYENLDRFKEAEMVLKEAQEEASKSNLKTEQLKINLRKARLAARQSNLGEANNLLEKSLEFALQNNLFEIIVNAKLQLAEIDLLKYRMTNETSLLTNALIKIEDCKLLCLDQDYKIILIDIYILQGLLLSMNNQQKQSKKILELAINLAKELNLKEKELEAQNQLKEIEKEKKNILVKIITRINQSIRNTIIFESMSKPKKVETEIKALYIVSKTTGLPFYQKEFDIGRKIDPNLLSGLLSAIRTMGQTVLESSEEGLKLIDHGDISIMLETGKDCFFALIVSRETYLLRERLHEFVFKFDIEKYFKEIDNTLVLVNEQRNEEISNLINDIFKK